MCDDSAIICAPKSVMCMYDTVCACRVSSFSVKEVNNALVFELYL